MRTIALAIALYTAALATPVFAQNADAVATDARGKEGADRLRLGQLLAEAPRLAPGLSQDTAMPAVTPALGTLVAEALQNNPELRAAANETEAASQRVRPAGALDDPMLEAGFLNVPVPSWRLNREDMTMKMLGVSQKLPYPGKRALRQQVAAKDAESVGYGLRETANRIVRDVKLAYFDLALAGETIRQLQNNRLVLEQFLRIAESRYATGQATQAEVLKAQTQLGRMSEELLRMERERPVMEADLMRLLGRREDAAPIAAALPGMADAVFSLDALQQAALRERPQLLGLQSMIERSAKTLELARKEVQPDFDLRVAYGQRDKDPAGVPREDMVSLTLAFNLPVWRQDKIEPRIAEAQAMREQALEVQQAQQNEVRAKLRQQVAIAEQSRKSVRLYETGILPQARLAVEASLSGYKVSRVDPLMLLDSQMTLFNYEINRAKELVNFNKALAEIELLTGKGVFRDQHSGNSHED
jgi:outer membrane protein TolC